MKYWQETKKSDNKIEQLFKHGHLSGDNLSFIHHGADGKLIFFNIKLVQISDESS
jgi:hypothetical protein